MIEEKKIIQETLEITDYVFTMEKVEIFLKALESLPSDEIGYYTVYTLTRLKRILFVSEIHGNIEEREQLFALSTDFKKEHAHLRALAEEQAIFYALSSETTLFGEFLNFLPEQYSEKLNAYLKKIGKI